MYLQLAAIGSMARGASWHRHRQRIIRPASTASRQRLCPEYRQVQARAVSSLNTQDKSQGLGPRACSPSFSFPVACCMLGPENPQSPFKICSAQTLSAQHSEEGPEGPFTSFKQSARPCGDHTAKLDPPLAADSFAHMHLKLNCSWTGRYPILS